MAKPGPKPKIDAARAKQVYAILSVGGSLRDAAGFLGISYQTMVNARRRDPEFCKGVKRAVRNGKIQLLRKMGKAKQWQAAAWMLERRWGRQYGRKDRVDVTSKGKEVKGTLGWTVNPDGRVNGAEHGRITSEN